MNRQMYLNLPVKDLNRSVEFFTKMGFEFDQNFTDENATCMIVGDGAVVMLLAEDFFRTFIPTPIVDAASHTEAIVGVSASSRAEVDELADTALANGAGPARDAQDYDFMYGRSFADPDGHLWEVIWMDAEAVDNAG